MKQIYSSFSETVLLRDLPKGDACIEVSNGDQFRTPQRGEFELATLNGDGDEYETVSILKRTGRILFVDRGIEGTQKDWKAGTQIGFYLTRAVLESLATPQRLEGRTLHQTTHTLYERVIQKGQKAYFVGFERGEVQTLILSGGPLEVYLPKVEAGVAVRMTLCIKQGYDEVSRVTFGTGTLLSEEDKLPTGIPGAVDWYEFITTTGGAVWMGRRVGKDLMGV